MSLIIDGLEAVQVQAIFPSDGRPPLPARMWWDDQPFPVRILGVQPAARRRAGGIGVRYSSVVDGNRKVLYYIETDDEYFWFLELSPPADGNPIREHFHVGRIYEHPAKAYVAVLAMFTVDGTPPTPNVMWWVDGTEYEIQSAKYDGEAASQIAGGIGLRYRCRIRSQVKNLYYEKHTLRWFVERGEGKAQR